MGGITRMERYPDLEAVSVGTEVTYYLVDYQIDLVEGGQRTHFIYKWIAQLNFEETSHSEGEWLDGPGSTNFKGHSLKWKIKWKKPGKHFVSAIEHERSPGKLKMVRSIGMEQHVVSLESVLGASMKEAEKAPIPKPERELSLVRRYIEILEAADKNPNWGVKLHKDRLKELTEYRDRISKIDKHYQESYYRRTFFRAVYLDQTSGEDKAYPLRVFYARHPEGEHDRSVGVDNWFDGIIVDWTNPKDPRFDKQFLGRTQITSPGAEAERQVIERAIDAWDGDNRYYPGAVKYDLRLSWETNDKKLIRADKSGTFKTDGKDSWDDLSEFLSMIAQGTGIAAVVLIPFVGGAWLAGLTWVSLFSSTADSVIRLSQMHTYGDGNFQEAAMDVINLVGNVFGAWGMAWKRGATVLAKHPGKKGAVVKFFFIGKATTDGIQGFLLLEQFVGEYDQIMSDTSLSPEERSERLMKLFASASTTAGMALIDMNPKSKSVGKRRKKLDIPEHQIERIGLEGEVVDTTSPVKMRGRTKDKRQKTTVDDTHDLARKKEFAKNDDIPTNKKPRKRWNKARDPSKRGMLNKHHHAIMKQAQGSGEYIFVRDGNPDSVPYIGKEGYEAKPMELKAKTAKSGGYKGLAVANPKDADLAEMLANDAKYKDLPSHTERYNQYVKDLKKDGFDVNPREGFTVSRGGKKFYSDYDLHGVYDAETGDLKDATRRMNDTNRRADQNVIRHTAHDEWPDRLNAGKASTNYGPQPPVTVYAPDGKAYQLETLEDMVDFCRSREPPLNFEQRYEGLDWKKWREFQDAKGNK